MDMQEVEVDAVKWLSTLGLLQDEVCETEQQIEENVKSNDECKEAYIHSVETFKKEIIARLDQLVAKAIISGEEKYKDNDDILNKLINRCKDSKDAIQEQKTIINDLSHKKKKSQLYTISHTLTKGLQDMSAVVKQSSFENRIVKFSFEKNFQLQAYLLNDTKDIGTLQEICKESDEVVDDEVVNDEVVDNEVVDDEVDDNKVVDDSPSLSKVSVLKSKAPRPLPRQHVPGQSTTLQTSQMKAYEHRNDDVLLETLICKGGNLSSLKTNVSPTLPPKSVGNQLKTLQENKMEMCELNSDDVVIDTQICKLNNLSLLNSEVPPPLPPKPVLKEFKTLQDKTTKMCEFNHDDILLGTNLFEIPGSCFAVYRGVLKPSGKTVAVKTCIDSMSKEQKQALVREGLLIMQFDHQNIAKLIGIAEQRKPVMLIMENFSGGTLLNYLQTNGKKMTNIQKANLCLDVANGMVYLSGKGCIHRDLQAKNCLVGDKNIVKIYDFGMAKVGDKYIPEGKESISIKWTAPEALDYGMFTTMCDVWSYGILMWEIFSNGLTPYPGWTDAMCREQVTQGYSMPAPQNTPYRIGQLMQRCWDAKLLTRITFKEILDSIAGRIYVWTVH